MKLAHDNMYGLYASRRYESEQIITVYVGDDIGAYNGETMTITRGIVRCRRWRMGEADKGTTATADAM